MTRHLRNDSPDTWHHVMNRGIARRTLFESERDIRTFLSRLAWVIRAGLIEVHAYCVLTTHYHLLARSPVGALSEAMAVVQNGYSRWFNRGRRRDGPLYRSRFRSKRASALTYRRHLVRYIDANAVEARLVDAPQLYPHGSARHYARTAGPVWLSRDWIEETVMRSRNRASYEPQDYAGVFGRPLSPRLLSLVERRISLSNDADDPLDELLHAAQPRVMEWMRRKSRLADGSAIGLPVCHPLDVDDVVAEMREQSGEWIVTPRAKPIQAWPVAHVALLRDLAGATLHEAALHTGSTVSRAWKRYDKHRALVENSEAYVQRMAVLARDVLARCHGGGVGADG